jgi:zinc and cadmium transporter
LFPFHVLEQFLHWHHCHRPINEHRPLGYLILAADGLHNLIGVWRSVARSSSIYSSAK